MQNHLRVDPLKYPLNCSLFARFTLVDVRVFKYFIKYVNLTKCTLSFIYLLNIWSFCEIFLYNL